MTPSDRQLLAVVKKGDVKATEQLLVGGANPNVEDSYGLSALIWAARKGYAEVADTLLLHGADPNRKDRTGRTPLHHAVGFKRRDLLEPLIRGGSDIEARDMHSYTALDLANSDFTEEIAESLIDLGARGEVRDPGTISVGVVSGGPESHSVDDMIAALNREIVTRREPNPKRERGHLNVVFHVPGSMLQPEFEGVRTGRFSKKKRTLIVQCAVPSAIPGDEKAFLLRAFHEAVDLAEPIFGKAQIAFPASSIRELLDQLEGGLG